MLPWESGSETVLPGQNLGNKLFMLQTWALLVNSERGSPTWKTIPYMSEAKTRSFLCLFALTNDPWLTESLRPGVVDSKETDLAGEEGRGGGGDTLSLGLSSHPHPPASPPDISINLAPCHWLGRGTNRREICTWLSRIYLCLVPFFWVRPYQECYKLISGTIGVCTPVRWGWQGSKARNR